MAELDQSMRHILGEHLRISEWITSLFIVGLWLTGFLALIRFEFKRRHRNADVFKALWIATILGFALLAAPLVPMHFVR